MYLTSVAFSMGFKRAPRGMPGVTRLEGGGHLGHAWAWGLGRGAGAMPGARLTNFDGCRGMSTSHLSNTNVTNLTPLAGLIKVQAEEFSICPARRSPTSRRGPVSNFAV